MNNTSLPGLISSGDLSSLSARDTIIQIKAAAIRQFQALDARMLIHSTEYFNHTFAPDLVLRWPSGSGAERYVYMRSSVHDEVLADDVARLGDLRPILLELVPVHDQKLGKSNEQGLNRLALEKNTLVTDPAALASIGEAKRDRPVTSLFSTALAQGGRGLLADEDARVATEAIADGFDGARRIASESVFRAAETADDHLSTPFANRFNRLLQAVWIASGGRADLFPHSQSTLTTGIDDDALEYLLDLEPIRDLDFWRGIGRSATVVRIGKLAMQHPNENLQFLVKANLDHLAVRSCRVQDRYPQLDEQDRPDFWWLTERGALALRSREWMAFVAEKAEDLSNIDSTSYKGISIPDLLERVRETVLTSLQMSDGAYEVDLSSSEQGNVTHSDHLQAVAESFGKTARVLRARALAGGRQISCDFSRSSASTTTSSTVTITELLGVSLPLLRPLSDDDRTKLEDLLRPPEDPNTLPPDDPRDPMAEQTKLPFELREAGGGDGGLIRFELHEVGAIESAPDDSTEPAPDDSPEPPK